MLKPDMLKWLETASYSDLLKKWRFEAIGSEWFRGEVGDAFVDIMAKRRAELTHEEKVEFSKRVGWL